MPVVRNLKTNLWEIRSNLNNERIARVLFTVYDRQIALLHGFSKKSKKTPVNDLNLGRSRRDLWQSEW